MTLRLDRAIEKLEALPGDVQDHYAATILANVEKLEALQAEV